MSDPTTGFGNVAQRLARNPLGIIALFIVMVYGFAALVTGVSASFTADEKLPLIYFLVIFPVLVLGVFGWLVSRHSNKLFAPSDFRDEENYVRVLTATACLAVASAKGEEGMSAAGIRSVVASVQEASAGRPPWAQTTNWHGHILWVDDQPENNVAERSAFEAMGITFSLAYSTEEAMSMTAANRYVAIISGMGRREGPREGYVLLDRLRASGDRTPLFFYSSSNSLEHKREAPAHDGQGCTNNPQELFRMVMRAVVNR